MKLELIENNLVLSLSIDFSLAVIKYCEQLEANRQYIVARQLLRSATSIGANSFEAQNHESTADFIHKFKIYVANNLIFITFAPLKIRE